MVLISNDIVHRTLSLCIVMRRSFRCHSFAPSPCPTPFPVVCSGCAEERTEVQRTVLKDVLMIVSEKRGGNGIRNEMKFELDGLGEETRRNGSREVHLFRFLPEISERLAFVPTRHPPSARPKTLNIPLFLSFIGIFRAHGGSARRKTWEYYHR